MVYNRETGQDISEDKEGFNQEGVDSDEEEDEEESSDEEMTNHEEETKKC